MKAAHVFPTFVRSRTEGITNNVEGLCRALRRRNVDAHLRSPGVELEELNNNLIHVRQGWRAQRLVIDALDDETTDIVHYHIGIPALAAFTRVARVRRLRRRKPILVHVWNAFYRSADGPAPVPPAERVYHAFLNGPLMASAGLEGADGLLVSSHFQADQLKEAGVRPPVYVVSNGVDTRRFSPASPAQQQQARRILDVEGDPVVLYYGHLSPWKGVDHFVDALPHLFRAVPGATALISHTRYGNGADRLRARLKARGVLGRVRLLDCADVPTLHAAADIAVVPAVAAVGTACHPNVLLEILSAGLPVVASQVGSIPEAVRDGRTGLLARPGKPLDIADRLIQLAQDPALRRRMGRAARADVMGRFDWDLVANQVDALYQALGTRTPAAAITPRPAPERRKVPQWTT